MADFNPDKYLEKKTDKKGFDPDAYLNKKEDYYNPIEKVGMSGLQALLSIPGVEPVIEGIDKYVASPVRRAIQEGPVEAIKQYGEKAPGFKETLVEKGVSTKSPSDILPSLYSEDPEEYKKALTFKKGGLFDPSLAGFLGLGGDILTDPTTYIGAGAAAKGISKVAKGTKEVGEEVLKAGAKKAVTKLPQGAQRGLTLAKAASEGAVEGAKEIGETVAGTFKPKIDPYVKKAVSIAEREGLDPALVINPNIEFGNKSTVAKNYRALMQSPGGDDMVAKYELGRQQISDTVHQKISKIAGTEDFPRAPEEAGILVRDSYKQAVDNFFNQRDLTYDTVQKVIPELNKVGLTDNALNKLQSSLTGIRRRAIGLSKGATTEMQAQGRILFDLANELQNTAQKKSFRQLVSDLRSIGETGFGAEGVQSKVMQGYRDAYSALSEALVDTVDGVGGKEIANGLRENNRSFTEFFKKQKFIDDIMTNDALGGERIYSAFLNGNTKLLDDYLSIVGDEGTKKQLAAFLVNKAIRDKDGLIRFGSSKETLLKNDQIRRSLSRLVNPDELKEIIDVLELGERYGLDILNPSGTAEYGLFQNLKQSLIDRPGRKASQKFMETAARTGGEVSPAQIKAPVSQVQGSLANLVAEGGANAPRAITTQGPSVGGLLEFLKNKSTIGMYTPVLREQQNRRQ